jgi:inositol-phosphate transport system permease protein
MVTETAKIATSPERDSSRFAVSVAEIVRAVRSGLLVALLMAVLIALFRAVLQPAIVSVGVEETVTFTLASLLAILLPYAAYIACASTGRHRARTETVRALVTTLVAVAIVYAVATVGQLVTGVGVSASQPSLQITVSQAENGVRVDAVEPGGAAELAGVQVGDVITAIRRDEVNLESLLMRISQAEAGDPLRLRILRGGEELQLTVNVASASAVNSDAVVVGLGIALFVGVVSLFWPSGVTPYILLILFLSPMLLGYAWLIIATFSYRTEGLLPLDGQGNVGGLTLDNWSFLYRTVGSNPSIWVITLNTLAVALMMTVLILLISAMAGYALSRMNFRGRKLFLSFTLILHGFPAVTLLISIFFVLNFLGGIPIIGDIFGYNTLGGVALVMVGFELPLGIWLMKGFFDNIPWDMERSALIDGASRWRTFWEILLPQIRPGILALGIFAFLSGWSAYLIPRTYSLGTNSVTLAVYLNQLRGDTSPVNWNTVAAVGLFQLIPIMVFFIFAQEYLLNIYAGGTKGSS